MRQGERKSEVRVRGGLGCWLVTSAKWGVQISAYFAYKFYVYILCIYLHIYAYFCIFSLKIHNCGVNAYYCILLHIDAHLCMFVFAYFCI